MPYPAPGASAMNSSRTRCDQPMTKIASGRSLRTASIVSGAFTSTVSTSGAPTSSNEHWPERLGSIGPGSVTTPTISAPASRAASRQSRPIVSKLTQTARTGADSTKRRSVASANRQRAPCFALRELPGPEGERPGDERAHDDPRRLRHVHDLHARQDKPGRKCDPQRPVREPDAELA